MSAIGVVFLWQLSDPEEADRFILGIDGWALSWDGEPVDEHPLSWIVHLLMHVDVFHLAGNLIFMWVFGNAVCAKVGNLAYLALWTGGGILASITERLVHPESAILGASGAISVAVGFFVIFWAFNEVTIFYFVFITVTGTFSVSAWWVILAYAAFDLIGIISSDGEAAYLAHLGGYAIGAPVAVLLLKTGLLHAEPYEMTLLDRPRRPGGRRDRAGAGRGRGPRSPDARGRHGLGKQTL